MAKAKKGATAREAGIGQGADRRGQDGVHDRATGPRAARPPADRSVFHARRSMHSLLIEGVDLMLVKHKG